jgi:hypothetical protein
MDLRMPGVTGTACVEQTRLACRPETTVECTT